MRRTWLAGIAGAVLVGGLSTGVVLAAADPDKDKGRPPAGERGQSGEAHGQGFGPPPWAHGHGSDAKGHADKAWKDAWKAMTEQERKQLMRDLGRAHAEGMRDFAECVADARAADGAAGDESAESGSAGKAARADCDKPLPPGHAKREAVS